MKLIEDLGMQYPTSKSKQKTRYGIYECPVCGKHFRVAVNSVKTKHTQSCGCESYAGKNNANYTHGKRRHPLYSVWAGILRRCYNPNETAYKNYGGRGITIHSKWRSGFAEFYNWAIENGWKKGLYLDRIDSNGNYEPLNCRFITPLASVQNRRINKNNTSGFRGVGFHKGENMWYASLSDGKKRHHLGYFKDPISAAKAVNAFIIEHGTFHPLNIIPE